MVLCGPSRSNRRSDFIWIGRLGRLLLHVKDSARSNWILTSPWILTLHWSLHCTGVSIASGTATRCKCERSRRIGFSQPDEMLLRIQQSSLSFHISQSAGTGVPFIRPEMTERPAAPPRFDHQVFPESTENQVGRVRVSPVYGKRQFESKVDSSIDCRGLLSRKLLSRACMLSLP